MTFTKNPVATAVKKAQAWFRDPALVTEPETIQGFSFPEAMVHVGRIVAIEYASDKFDGKEAIYRHEFTRERDLFLDPRAECQCFVILPGCKVTTRGIEG